MTNINIEYYSNNAGEFFTQYQSLSFELVHSDWMDMLPEQGLVLDVGCGSGRDAFFMAEKGLSVIAVEPALPLLDKAKQAHNHPNITWLSDQLPELSAVFGLQVKFDLMLLSAVWMHIPESQRQRTLRKLSNLLKPNGRIVISLRFGDSPDKRIMYPVSADELSRFAGQFGLSFRHIDSGHKQNDALGRPNVYWETVILTLPDDGTGSFPLIRNIVVNDNKSSTYKIALLRVLLRIAEGHPGAVLSQDDSVVELPLGLVALYWLKLYKPLVDTFGMQQNSNTGAGLGFIKPDGWLKLTQFHQSDFRIGSTFQAPYSRAVYQTLKDIAVTIRDMPVKYITLPNSARQVFAVTTARTTTPQSSLTLNATFLKSLGSFAVPRNVWDVLSRYSVWIEPTVVNEWCALMSVYKTNAAAGFTKLDYLQALTIEEPVRTTNRVRQRVEQLLQLEPVSCVWSAKRLSSGYAIDHAFPFSRWPNNDLWNLLPATQQANSAKSDKLPSAARLEHARTLITDWWQLAWQSDTSEFFTQAALALPQLGYSCKSYDDVFEAMRVQRDRLKDFQQLSEWL